MACVGEFQKHSWGDGDICQREGCGAKRGGDEQPVNGKVQPQQGGIFAESLDDIKKEQFSQESGVARSRWQEKQARKAEATREQKELLRAKGENVARGVHALQGFVAQQTYSYDSSSHFQLSAQEVRSLGASYAEVLEAFGIEFDSKWAALFMLLAGEFAISKRQWEMAAQTYYEQHPAEEQSEIVQ
jgi:hypothetical protein